MKNKFHLLKFCILALFLTFSACKKQESLDNAKAETKSKDTVEPYSFDWENTDFMPAPAGSNILVPWASNANRSFPLIYATDIKKADGWELVYNTFSPTGIVQPAFFALYNRYRGILRGYFYRAPTSPVPSSNVVHTLTQKTNGNNAPVLSYSAAAAVNLSIANDVSTLVQPYRTASTGTWYAAEFEMAYDPNVGSKSAASNLMEWDVNSVNITDIKINGISKGSVNGTITQPITPVNLIGSLFNGASQIIGIAELNSMGLGSIFTNAVKSALQSGLQGNVKNVSNGIFGGVSTTDSTRQYVKLTTNTQYTLNGTSTDIYLISNPTMIIPGSSGQGSVTGFTPLYTNPLGIMSLSAAPVARLSPLSTTLVLLDPNSYQIIWNPAIINSSTNGATISNLKQTIISYENYFWDEGLQLPWPPTLTEYDGDKPYLNNPLTGNSQVYSWPNFRPLDYQVPFMTYYPCYYCDNPGPLSIMTDLTFDQKIPNHVLRISFDVVPNNGAPKSTIVKSFNIIYK